MGTVWERATSCRPFYNTALPPTHTTMNYYYSIDGTDVIGPCPLVDLASIFATGALPASTQVCAEGQEAWQPLSAVIDTCPPPPLPTQGPVRPVVRAQVPMAAARPILRPTAGAAFTQTTHKTVK